MKVIIEMENKYPLNVYADLMRCKPGDVVDIPEDFYEGIDYALTQCEELDEIDRIVLEHKYKFGYTINALQEVYGIIINQKHNVTEEYIEYELRASLHKLSHPNVYRYITDGYHKASEYYKSAPYKRLINQDRLEFNDECNDSIDTNLDEEVSPFTNLPNDTTEDTTECEITKVPRVLLADIGIPKKTIKILQGNDIIYVDQLKEFLNQHFLDEIKGLGPKRIKNIMNKLEEYRKTSNRNNK